MKKFWKWAVILMTATVTTGLATSCEEKDNTEPEDEPVTIRKTNFLLFRYFANAGMSALVQVRSLNDFSILKFAPQSHCCCYSPHTNMF